MKSRSTELLFLPTKLPYLYIPLTSHNKNINYIICNYLLLKFITEITP